MNAMIHQSNEANIALFVKKAKAAKKRKEDANINNIDEELDDLRLTGYVISFTNSTEDTILMPEILGWNLISMGPDWPKVITNI